MKRHLRRWTAILTLPAILFSGCAPTRPFYFYDDGDLSHYKGVATEIEYADVDAASLDEVTQTAPPLTVANNEPKEYWDLTLEEAIRAHLTNGKVIRDLSASVATNEFQINGITRSLLASPETAVTVYTPSTVESNPNFGTEGALSQFDTQLSSTLFWNHNDQPRNLAPTINGQNLQIFNRQVFEQDTSNFATQLLKYAADGSSLAARHNVNYDWNNNPSNLFPSVWTTNIEAEFNHPLLQGGGVDYNRIVGPFVGGYRQQTGVLSPLNTISGAGQYDNYNGIALARIRTDLSLAEFEKKVRDSVNQVERTYWALYDRYRRLNAEIEGRDIACDLIPKNADNNPTFTPRFTDQYYEFRGRVETTLTELYQVEHRLRYLMGLTASDCRLIRPCDHPKTAKVAFDWCEIHAEALARSPELRKQRWLIKDRELRLLATKNLLLPRLDANAIYRWRGLGDELRGNGNGRFDGAYDSLLSGDFQEWQVGFTFAMPLGFRQALSAIRYAQLNLARERSVLQEMELAISHQMSERIRELDRDYQLMQTNLNRLSNAREHLKRVTASNDLIRNDPTAVLNAQRFAVEAEIAYYNSVCNYQRAVVAVHYEKNSMLDYFNIHLAEGPWTGKAYRDAKELARQRDAGLFLNYGFTRPNVFSQGPGVPYDGPAEWSEGMPSPHGGETIDFGRGPGPTVEQLPPGEPTLAPSPPSPPAELPPEGKSARIVDGPVFR